MSKIFRLCSNCGHTGEDVRAKPFLYEDCPECRHKDTYLIEAKVTMLDYLKEAVGYMSPGMVGPMIKLVRAFTTGKEDLVVPRVNAFHKEFGSGNPDNVLIKVKVRTDSRDYGEVHEFFLNIDKNKYKTDDSSLMKIAHAVAFDRFGNYPWMDYKHIETVTQYEDKEGKKL